MTLYSTPQQIVLGTSDLTGPTVDFAQLPDGDLFAVNYIQDSTTTISQSQIEFLQPGADSITNVTAQATSGAMPSGIGTLTLVNEFYVGDNTLPDIVLSAGGLDQAPWYGGQVTVLAPNANGQYVDVTSELPQQLAFNHRLSTGEINGQAAIAVAMIANQVGNPVGIELLIANPNGTFTDWSSHLPADIASLPTPGGYYGVYTCTAIADFTGNGGDIFLGSDQNFANNVLLVNNGSGYFTAETIDVPKPAATGGASSIAVFALPTQFAGDTHEDLIVDYYNTTADDYALQFLQGNGQGGFTDVTAKYFPDQPVLTNSFGNTGWVQSLQAVTINGLNALIMYQANGAPEILVSNAKGVYSASPIQVPNSLIANYGTDLTYSDWGTDAGVGGFYGYTNANQWVFIPITTAYANPTSATLNQPLANNIYLYGDGSGAATATTLSQSFDTQISVTANILNYVAGATDEIDLIVNGVKLTAQVLEETYGQTVNGQAYSTPRTLTFDLPGVVTIKSLTISEGSDDQLYVQDVSVNGVDLGNSVHYTSSTTQTIDATPWNDAIDPTLGTASDPILVTGGGAGPDTAYVLGDESQYTITSIGPYEYLLSENSGLDQNAILTGIAYVSFQGGETISLPNAASVDAVSDNVTGGGFSSFIVKAADKLEIGELGPNGKAEFQAVGSIPSDQAIVGAGDFYGTGVDALLIQSSRGALEIGAISGDQISYTHIGTLAPEWQIEGVGDLLGESDDQFLIENTSGTLKVGQIGADGKATYTDIGHIETQWTIQGVGDFLGDGKAQILLRDSNGGLDVDEVGLDGKLTSDHVGTVGASWTIEGVGDFLGDGQDQFLVENGTGQFKLGQVGADGGVSYSAIGKVGPEWAIEGVGNFSGSGPDSVILHNTHTGALELGTVVGGDWHYTLIGSLGAQWTFHDV